MNGVSILATTGGTSMSDAVSSLTNLVPTVLDMIMANSVLAAFFCAGIIGIVIGIVKKLK